MEMERTGITVPMPRRRFLLGAGGVVGVTVASATPLSLCLPEAIRRPKLEAIAGALLGRSVPEWGSSLVRPGLFLVCRRVGSGPSLADRLSPDIWVADVMRQPRKSYSVQGIKCPPVRAAILFLDPRPEHGQMTHVLPPCVLYDLPLKTRTMSASKASSVPVGFARVTYNMPSYELIIWTVYDSPVDRPGRFVARAFRFDDKGQPYPSDAANDVLEASSLDELRAMRRPGLITMMRDPDDDPKIVETWI